MQTWISNFLKRWSLVQRFTIVSFVIMIFGMVGIGWWVGEQIKRGVIDESAVTGALYMDSFISPNLQELAFSKDISARHVAILNNLLRETDLGQRIVAFKVWDEHGILLYSKGSELFGDTPPSSADQMRVWQGEVVTKLNNSPVEQNLEKENFNSRVLEIYSPVRLGGTDHVIAMAEFYQKVDTLEADISSAQRRSWLFVGTAMAAIYLLLVWFVRWADRTIERQEHKLTDQVAQLTELLTQNNELHQRVQRAAANATALNERFLRRISADLHDGPTQELGVALLRLDHFISQNETLHSDDPNFKGNEQLPVIQTSLQQALKEMRSIAAGFGLPQLDSLTLPELIRRVIHSHEQRTATKVLLKVENLPGQTDLPVKITIYRLIQEALNNAHRHADGAGQQVHVISQTDDILIEVIDQGPGFDVTKPIDWDDHLGLSGMRERVESLGGLFKVESVAGLGTKVIARLPLHPAGEKFYG